ncbi:MAG: hypothetical protein EBU96_08920 [Actinobacteria bacterium]|nr:hypothetical protein [Actinomycetota bacterium]
MPRYQKRVPTPEIQNDIEWQEDYDQVQNHDQDKIPEEPFEETATDRVAAMMQGIGADDERAEVKVYRVRDGQLEYCRGFKPDEFETGNFDMLRDRFGAGLYELRLYATNPTNKKFTIRSKLRVTIAEDRIETSPGAQLSGGMAQVLQTIAQGQQQMLEALVSIKQAPPKDSMEEMGKMLTMMAAMREAFGMNQPQGREKSSIGEIVSAIRELRGAAEEISPPSEKEPDGLMSVLPKMLELVSKGQESQQAAQQAAQFPPVQLPASFQAPEQPNPAQFTQQPEQAPAPTQDEADMKVLTMIKLKSYLKTLVDMAVKVTPVDLAAEFVYEKIPDDLIEIMALDNWFDLLAAVAPDVKDHKEWLQKVRDKALSMFEDAETEQPKK